MAIYGIAFIHTHMRTPVNVVEVVRVEITISDVAKKSEIIIAQFCFGTLRRARRSVIQHQAGGTKAGTRALPCDRRRGTRSPHIRRKAGARTCPPAGNQ